MRSTLRLAQWVPGAASHLYKQYAEERRRPILPAPHRPTPRLWPEQGLHAAWIGHSTVLLKIDGVTILTDPVFSRRVGIRVGPATVGLRRLVEPALSIAELPRIDVILLSHAHMDHFDIPSLRLLEGRSPVVVTAAGTSDLLRVGNYRRVGELKWDQSATVGPLTIRAFRVNHWGARVRTDMYRGYNGYTIEAGRHRVLFGGDTALTDSFRGLKSHGPYELAIMPVGAYNPWVHYHCTPEQAWRMAQDAGFEFFLPVHHQTLRLSREPYLEPIERIENAAGRSADRVAVRRIGQEFHLQPACEEPIAAAIPQAIARVVCRDPGSVLRAIT